MKILLATDGTKYGQAAAEMLRKLAIEKGDEIKIICVVDMAVPLAVDVYGGYMPDTTEIEKAARENACKIVEDTVAQAREWIGDAAISSDVLYGSPESRVVETAEEMGADLIVLGSHGYKSWERLLLGSVSNSVVHHAPCSVLVVRAPAE
ncbi:MAG: universal stress protein [Acidobacteria bacterium]|nr:universal stress protein [Acidobacteriota bacterium]